MKISKCCLLHTVHTYIGHLSCKVGNHRQREGVKKVHACAARIVAIVWIHLPRRSPHAQRVSKYPGYHNTHGPAWSPPGRSSLPGWSRTLLPVGPEK